MAATGPTARARGRLLLRGQSIAAPLFMPLLHAVACQIESLAPRDLVTDPGKLARGLAALWDAAPTDALVTCCAAAIEAEAAGAELDWEGYPPRVARRPEREVAVTDLVKSSRLAVALEATRRLSATARGEPLLVAALTGPTTLAGELAGEGAVSAAILERAGAIGVELAGEFCRAGANLIVLLETELPSDDAMWRSAVGPIVKVARFHQAPAVLVGASPPRATLGMSDEGAVAFPEEVTRWPSEPPFAKLVTTRREVPSSTSIAGLRAACLRLSRPPVTHPS